MSAGGQDNGGGLRAGVEALADEWEREGLTDIGDLLQQEYKNHANRLRALLAAQSGPEVVGGGGAVLTDEQKDELRSAQMCGCGCEYAVIGEFIEQAEKAALEAMTDKWQWVGWSETLLPYPTQPIAGAQAVLDWMRAYAKEEFPETPEPTHQEQPGSARCPKPECGHGRDSHGVGGCGVMNCVCTYGKTGVDRALSQEPQCP